MPATPLRAAVAIAALTLLPVSLFAQMGKRFPAEKKIVPDPVTGIPLTFLTSSQVGDAKIYPTHPQWTADGKWIVFRSNRARGQAFAVNEETGDIVQLTSKGYLGMLCNATRSMKLYLMRAAGAAAGAEGSAITAAPPPAGNEKVGASPAATPPPRTRSAGPGQIIEIDLQRLLADSAAGRMQDDAAYERVCGTTPEGVSSDGNMGLDANEEEMYFRVSGPAVAARLPAGQEPAKVFGPRNMGAGPTGLASMSLKTGEFRHIITVPFQIGHVQTNQWVPGEIVFCWETGGKAPQRTWVVQADGTGLRPLYPEAEYEWVTHEAVVTRDEVALAIVAHLPVGTKNAWGIAGTAEHPAGLAIVNLRTREMRLAGQVPFGNPGRSFWHVHGSPDGRWAVADDFQYRTWIIDRRTGETRLLADNGHKTTASDHQHPTFNADGTKIEIQSAMLDPEGKALNIAIIPVPKNWLTRTYPPHLE